MEFTVTIPGGLLGNIYDRVSEHFLHGIDPAPHAEAYVGEHPFTFAESEFAGKYMAICMTYAARRTVSEADAARMRSHAMTVAESVMKNQRADGYIGGLTKENELDWFGVWNQAFTLLGLLAIFDQTGDERLLAAAERIGLWVARRFSGNEDILNSDANFGSQHLSILMPLVRLCQRSTLGEIHAFTRELAGLIKGSDNNFFAFDSILDLRSKKGIENFFILLGMLEYGDFFGDPEALPACIRYWEELDATQIRENGNGTLVEFWTEGGNQPRMLSAEQKPDENCVAVGWLELCLALFWRTRQTRFIDAIEKTLFNHLAGALNDDGTDFAYYQPNFGKRLTTTPDHLYKCCRYRGFTAVSHLPDMLFYASDKEVRAMVIANADYEDPIWSIRERTDYPYNGGATYTISVKCPGVRSLLLRAPARTDGIALTLDGTPLPITPDAEGYLAITRDWEAGEHTVILSFTPILARRAVEIDGVPRIGMTYGLLLLAAETGPDGSWESLIIDADAPVIRTGESPIAFDAGGVRVTDYASSGRREGREYAVWARRK